MFGLDSLFDAIGKLLESFANTSDPSLDIAANVLVWLAIAALVLWRLQSAIRGTKWATLSTEERRAAILGILIEAYETAEWLYSNVRPAAPTEEAKIELGAKKKAAALRYARTEARAMGVSSAEIATFPTRIETVAAAQKNGIERYGHRPYKEHAA